MKKSMEQNNSTLASFSEESALSELTQVTSEEAYSRVNNDEEAKG